MDNSQIPYWRLIAVLASTMQLSSALAMRLYHAAVELHRTEGTVVKLTGDLGEGEVRDLKKDLILGAIVGPGFEAIVETPEGAGSVKFIVTREGLGEAEEKEVMDKKLRGLPN